MLMSDGMRKQRVGRWGENLAAEFLEAKGWTILARNVRSPYGELDLVAQQGSITVFVEVKARTGMGFGLPEAAITALKRDHLLRAIQAYWQQKDEEPAWRVDVIAIRGRPGAKDVEIEHFENAITS
jgi:putative endonuclease